MMKKILQLSTLLLFAINGGIAFSQSPCDLEPDPGPCFAAIPAYYFNQDTQSCAEFIYGGCAGVVPFWTLEECESECPSDGFNPSDLCDSIIVSLRSVTQPELGSLGIITISMSSIFTTSYTFPYAGFQLMDADGLILASEELSSAPNVYGIGPYMNETRYLILPLSLPSPFSGQLNLVNSLFAGFPEVACSYPFTWSDSSTYVVDLNNNGDNSQPEIEIWYDLMGRQLNNGPTSGQFSIALYSDGSRKVVWIN
ncbi:BPTI/Kunitz domain-containing protein [Flavobacteriales bacterium]|nr:BPTI/Kunitz domain-containing protein [Flavobacteriales bacterium]